jgi:hypothetical protein
MWTIPLPCGELDLEDSEILRVTRSDGRLMIEFDRARVWNEGASTRIEGVEIHLEGVAGEDIEADAGEQYSSVGPGIEVPLNSVAVVEYSPGVLELQGYKNRVPWYVWRIHAAGISVRWGEVSYAAAI